MRVLGLYFREINSGILTVGVVFRGSKTLDGVLSGVLDGTNLTIEVVNMVRDSKHYGQIRVIICDSANLMEVDPSNLASTLEKPLIVIRDSGEFDELFMLNFEGLIIEPVGLSGSSARRVMCVISHPSGIPVLSSARLISKGVSWGA